MNSVRHTWRHTVLAVLCLLPAASDADDLVSGLGLGELASQFMVKDCTGPAAGKTLCYYCRYAERPVVALFVRELNDEVAQLVQDIDKSVAKHQSQRLAAFVVLIGKDTPSSEKRLKQVAKDRRLRHTPLTIYRDQPAKLTDLYRLAPEAAVTALVWQQGKIIHNSAYPTSRLTAGQRKRFVTSLESAILRHSNQSPQSP
ncbi:MAG TPA: hypothetical protein EYG57_01900 [Planctomycetes bacterium]|nr:hypothetical protein [Planctomycetaceae bacterium]HIM28290.1 hypothetical protein [Planctomycetota bacterium]